MSQRSLPLIDGHHVGPLFVPRIRRAPKPRMQSTFRDNLVRARTPAWANGVAMMRFYIEAGSRTRQTGVQHSVDHQVPLNHPTVCGLHVEHNLQVLPLALNIAKSNNHWPGMWGEQLVLI